MIKVQFEDKSGTVLQMTELPALPPRDTVVFLQNPKLDCQVYGYRYIQSSNDMTWTIVIKVMPI